MLTLIRTVYLENWPYIIKADYPELCPVCGVAIDSHAYGVHIPEWDKETVAEILEGTREERVVSIQAVMDCDAGHPVAGTMLIRRSTETEPENNVEYQCVAQTMARSHPSVEAILKEVPFARAAPGIFVPQGSHVESTKGLTPPVLLGHSCQIAQSAEVGPMVFLHEAEIGSQVRVLYSAVVKSCIHGPRVVGHAVVVGSHLDPEPVDGD